MTQQNPEHDRERPPPQLGRPLPRSAQFTILGFVTALIAVTFFIGPAVLHRLGLGAAAPLAEEPSQVDGQAFKATDKQWLALKIRPVEAAAFQDATETEGKIALDDDLVTPVFSPYSGHVTRLIAQAGDIVQRGDPLFAIRATELAQAQNDLIGAAAGLKTAQAQLKLAVTNEQRQHSLFQAQGAALKDWQQSQVDLATAQGSLNSASIGLAAVRSRLRILGKTDQDIGAIEATQDLQRLDADSIVPAPVAGTVVQRQIGLGQNIVSASAGAANPVFTIGDLSKVWLVANAREESAPLLHKGDAVEVSVLAFPGRIFNARLTYVAASIDANTHRLPVRAEVDNPGGELKPEMFASFRILSGSAVQAPAVPEGAIVYEGETEHVWVANSQQKTLEIRQFQAGRMHNGLVEVVSGLKPGDEIVTSGAVFIDRAVTGD